MALPAASDFSTRDYFISRSTADAAFAGWIGRLIELQGKTCVEQSRDFGPEDFMVAMHKAMLSGASTIALYSHPYLESKACVREATEALKAVNDPANEKRQLVPFRIEPCAPAGMLNVTYTDLIHERRQAEPTALAFKILRALGFADPKLEPMPPLPAGILTPPPRHIHPQIAATRSDLAPRPELIAQLTASMRGERRGSGPRVAALTNSRQIVGAVAGMGGVGKTVLARTWAFENQHAYDGVWWIDAEVKGGSRGKMWEDIASLGRLLSERVKAETNVEHAARETIRLIEASSFPRPFLLVYDNVERPADIAHWMPREGAHVLLTTRWSDWDPMIGKVDVGVLGREAAIDFLCDNTGRPDDRAEAGLLADELGCLPLALDHAASFCRAPPRQRFKVYRERVLAERLKHKPEPGARAGQYDHSVRETFDIALDRIIQGDATAGIKACPEVETVMGVAALLAPVPIPLSLFSHERFASADLTAAFRALGLYSLATFADDHPSVGPLSPPSPSWGGDGGGGQLAPEVAARGPAETTFTVHRLVQQVMHARLDAAGLVDDLSDTAMALLIDAFPQKSDDYANWQTCKGLAPHALACLASSRHEDWRQALLGFNVAKYFVQVARYGEAEPLLRRSLAIFEKTVGGDHPDTSAALHELASLYQAQGRYGEAEPLLKRSLAIYEKTVGGDHPSTSVTLHELAHLYLSQGRFAEAEPLFMRSLAIDEKTVGGDHPDTSATLHELARLYQAQGRYGEAEPLLKRSLSIKEKTVGGDHPSTATTLHELARLYLSLDCPADAEPLLRRSLAIRTKTLGPDHPRMGQSLDLLAQLTLAVGAIPEAEAVAREALAHREAKLHPGHPEIAESRWTLARVLIAAGRPAEARPLLDAAVALLESKVTPEQIWLAGARRTLATLDR